MVRGPWAGGGFGLTAGKGVLLHRHPWEHRGSRALCVVPPSLFAGVWIIPAALVLAVLLGTQSHRFIPCQRCPHVLSSVQTLSLTLPVTEGP